MMSLCGTSRHTTHYSRRCFGLDLIASSTLAFSEPTTLSYLVKLLALTLGT